MPNCLYCSVKDLNALRIKMKGTGFIVTRMITHLLYTYMHVCLINTDVHMNFFNIFYFEPNALNLKNNLSHSSAVPAILIKIRSSIPSLFFYCCCIRICRNHTWGHLLVNFILTNKIVGSIPQLHFLESYANTIFGFLYQLMLHL